MLASPTSTTAAIFSVDLSSASNQTVAVAYATADVTAQAGVDYVAASGTLTFAPGQTQESVAVPIDAAPDYDVSKTFEVSLSNPAARTIAQGTATGTIGNPNPEPTLSISNATVTASPNGTTDASFFVSLSATSDLPTTVDYATADGTASAGVDYVATYGTIVLAPGINLFSFVVPVDAEPAGAPTKTFSANLSNASGATIAVGQAIGTINTIVAATDLAVTVTPPRAPRR